MLETTAKDLILMIGVLAAFGLLGMYILAVVYNVISRWWGK